MSEVRVNRALSNKINTAITAEISKMLQLTTLSGDSQQLTIIGPRQTVQHTVVIFDIDSVHTLIQLRQIMNLDPGMTQYFVLLKISYILTYIESPQDAALCRTSDTVTSVSFPL
jgi:hypothetical protein